MIPVEICSVDHVPRGVATLFHERVDTYAPGQVNQSLPVDAFSKGKSGAVSFETEDSGGWPDKRLVPVGATCVFSPSDCYLGPTSKAVHCPGHPAPPSLASFWNTAFPPPGGVAAAAAI